MLSFQLSIGFDKSRHLQQLCYPNISGGFVNAAQRTER
jgi:hypothetical protein